MKKIYTLLLLLVGLSAVAQTGIIKGKVTTIDGKSAADVNVILVKADRNTVTLEDGSFVLRNIKAGYYTLVVSCAGLQSQSKEVAVNANAVSELKFTLTETARQLDEVIVEARRTANDKAVTIGKAPIPAMDLPQAIAVVDQGILQDQQA